MKSMKYKGNLNLIADWQKQDPDAASEAEKYENPIPSRLLILQHLAERGAPATREQLATEFKLVDEDALEALRRRLRAMERDAQVVYTRRGAYAPVDKLDLVLGRVMGHRDGFGFLIPDDGGEDLFLSPTQMRLVLDGDRALARVTGVDRKGRREGAIAEVISRAHATLVGRYNEENGIGFVIPDNSKLQQEILISPGRNAGAKLGQLVEVQITHWPTARFQAQGNIVEVLGDYMAPGMEIEVALRNYDIPHVWPEAVLRQVRRFKPDVQEADKKNRVDLRDLPFVTIDGEDARDFDDAVYCEAHFEPGRTASSGWRLYVAIADVSYYVNVDTALDNEARERGNSVYFPMQVIPMLPEELSNGLCSLNPHVDRLAMVCEIRLSRSGKMLDYQFYETIIQSHARLTYNKVSAMLEKPNSAEGKALASEYVELLPHLQQLYGMYKALIDQRQLRGALDFDTRETRIIFDDERKIEKIVPTVRNEAHRLIEECMLCANVAMAHFLQDHKLPGLYRVHDNPPEEKLEKLRAYLAELGLSLGKGRGDPSPKDYLNFLEKIKDRPDFNLIQTMMLRSMSQAVYSPDSIGHFGLNYEAYTHFTSPIRRYADLLNHRAVRSVIRSKRESAHVQRVGARSMVKSKIYPYDDAQLDTLGVQVSMTERRADEATRDVVTWLKCEYMLDRVGETFAGIITAVTGFGVFVELNDIFVEGLVHVTALPGDYYHYDQLHQCLAGERSGRKYRLGDSVEVVVARVDLDERKIDFEMSDAENTLSPAQKRNQRQQSRTQAASAEKTAVPAKVARSREAKKALLTDASTAKTPRSGAKPKNPKAKITSKPKATSKAKPKAKKAAVKTPAGKTSVRKRSTKQS